MVYSERLGYIFRSQSMISTITSVRLHHCVLNLGVEDLTGTLNCNAFALCYVLLTNSIYNGNNH